MDYRFPGFTEQCLYIHTAIKQNELGDIRNNGNVKNTGLE